MDMARRWNQLHRCDDQQSSRIVDRLYIVANSNYKRADKQTCVCRAKIMISLATQGT